MTALHQKAPTLSIETLVEVDPYEVGYLMAELGYSKEQVAEFISIIDNQLQDYEVTQEIVKVLVKTLKEDTLAQEDIEATLEYNAFIESLKINVFPNAKIS